MSLLRLINRKNIIKWHCITRSNFLSRCFSQTIPLLIGCGLKTFCPGLIIFQVR